MAMDDQELIDRATKAYFRNADESSPDAPANSSSVEEVDGKNYVVLRNVRGILKVYAVRKDHKLQAVEDWPSALAT